MIKSGSVVVVPSGQGERVLRMLRIDPDLAVISSEADGGERVEVEGLRIQGDDLYRLVLAFPDVRVFRASGRKLLREKLEAPKFIPPLLKCPNPNCVTNQPREPTKAGFWVVRIRPLMLQCNYCERYVDSSLALAQLLGNS